jgi:hypothetical protein
MPNVLTVTLDNETNPTCLDVNEKGDPNHVKHGLDWQTIRWKLDVKNPKASFNSQSDSEQGFAWIGNSRPPEGIFSEPVLRKRKVMVMAVLNDNDIAGDSENTKGEWIYQLSATIGSKLYRTNVTTDGRTTTNPRIKNT